MYKPLNMFLKQTDELKELIAKYPDYPIVVLCNYEVVGDEYSWWYAPEIRFSIGEILDCEQDINDEKVYTDRDEFEEDIEYHLSCYDEYENLSDENLDYLVEKTYQEYEPYWKKVIQIMADV